MANRIEVDKAADTALFESIKVVAAFANRARELYDGTKQWSQAPSGSCMTIRVPVALLNRIRDLDELAHHIERERMQRANANNQAKG